MIKNGKYYVLVPEEELNFKQLLTLIASSGAGRLVDGDGVPRGPWTPELLAEAISNVEQNTSGIDLRSVQLWFQDNDRGIGSDNIRWLAKVVGCGDAEETIAWQAKIAASNSRLAMERKRGKVATTSRQTKLQRSQKNDDNLAGKHDTRPRTSEQEVNERPLSSRLALRINSMLTGSDNSYVVVIVWGFWSVIAMSAIILGLADVKYLTNSGIEKHVGFFQSPSWTVEKLVLVPMYFIITTGGVIRWVKHRRTCEDPLGSETWEDCVSSYAPAFLLIIVVSVVVIFALQWYGTYFLPLLAGPNSDIEPNWIRVTTNPTTIIPLSIMVPLSLYGGMFIGFAYWLCFSSLLLLSIAARDITATDDYTPNMSDTMQVRRLEAARDLVTAFYRSIICGALINISIKVEALYLISDAESLFSWLKVDILGALGVDGGGWGWIPGGEFSSFTTAIFLLMITSVAYFGIYRIKVFVETILNQKIASYVELCTAPTFLIVSYFLLGEFTGFTVLLVASFIIAVMQLVWPITERPSKPSAGK